MPRQPCIIFKIRCFMVATSTYITLSPRYSLFSFVHLFFPPSLTPSIKYQDNPSEKDQNQGTLVVFNLPPSITNEELIMVFSEYGEVKEVRHTPNKKHHRFIEFYDIRHAEKAMKALNKTEIKVLIIYLFSYFLLTHIRVKRSRSNPQELDHL